MSKILGTRVSDEVYNYFERLAEHRVESISKVLRVPIMKYYEECKKLEQSYQKDE